jgi:hypothetical protein
VRRLAASIAISLGLQAAGCGQLPGVTVPVIATSVEQGFDGGAATFTVAPWPLDQTAAFLCLRKPGDEFTVQDPRPAAAAGCTPLEVATSGNRLTARMALEDVEPGLAAEFAGSTAPWYLAIAGSRGGVSAATVLTIVASPIPSDPGPS